VVALAAGKGQVDDRSVVELAADRAAVVVVGVGVFDATGAGLGIVDAAALALDEHPFFHGRIGRFGELLFDQSFLHSGDL
jgi:hypothetical protein